MSDEPDHAGGDEHDLWTSVGVVVVGSLAMLMIFQISLFDVIRRLFAYFF